MSKEKQIEKIARDLQRSEHWRFNESSIDFELDRRKTAENLYNAGYRKSEWISVEERLPEKWGYYLGCTYKGLMMIAPFFPVFTNDKPEFRYDIVYWMPLPEAPQMKGGEADA